MANEGGVTRDGNDPVYELGTLGCTGLEFNCHGFTEFLCQDRVEYAWLMQLLVGRITGAVSTEQVLVTHYDIFKSCYVHVLMFGCKSGGQITSVCSLATAYIKLLDGYIA